MLLSKFQSSIVIRETRMKWCFDEEKGRSYKMNNSVGKVVKNRIQFKALVIRFEIENLLQGSPK